MANEAAAAALDNLIAQIRALPNLAQEAMPAIAENVGAALREDLRAGRDPGTGEPWAPTKKGEQAMQGAADALSIAVVGTAVVCSIGKPYVFHHFGVRGEPARHCLPVGSSMPKRLGDAVRQGFVAPWRDKVGGR